MHAHDDRRVNVLVYAHRVEPQEHSEYARWLTALAQGAEPFALSELVLQGFVRVVTQSRIFKVPSTLAQAVDFIDRLRRRPRCQLLRPGPEHFDLFLSLCRAADARGKLVPDAYHAALAIEHGCQWVTNDTDFARFKGLRWRTIHG